MFVLAFTVLAAVAGLISYGAFDLGGSLTGVIFLTVFATGAFIRSLRAMLARGE